MRKRRKVCLPFPVSECLGIFYIVGNFALGLKKHCFCSRKELLFVKSLNILVEMPKRINIFICSGLCDESQTKNGDILCGISLKNLLIE